MKKKLVYTILGLGLMIISLTGCKETTRNFGGTTTVDLPKGKKLIEATWKDSDLWYLVRDMKENEQPETFELIEDSNCGILEGKVVFKESK